VVVGAAVAQLEVRKVAAQCPEDLGLSRDVLEKQVRKRCCCTRGATGRLGIAFSPPGKTPGEFVPALEFRGRSQTSHVPTSNLSYLYDGVVRTFGRAAVATVDVTARRGAAFAGWPVPGRASMVRMRSMLPLACAEVVAGVARH
jgi:hypothetical protein